MTLLLAAARTADGALVDVRTADGAVHAIAPAGELAPERDDDRVDLDGAVLLAAPAEPHTHLDKALTADLMANPTGDLAGAVAAWKAFAPTQSTAQLAARAETAARRMLAHGATAIRSHVNVDPAVGLAPVEALCQARSALAGEVDLQLAVMAYPLTGRDGADNRALLRDALAAGVDLVGGAPHLDPDPRAYLTACLDAATDAGVGVDLHIDEHLRADAPDLATLAQLVAQGFAHPVTASHCASLGVQPAEVQREIAEAVAAAGIAVVTLPATNLYLQGRDMPVATPRGLTAVDALRAAGVTVAGGADNMQDVFNPVGNGDPLETARLLVTAGHLDVDAAFACVTDAARSVIGLPRAAVVAGARADFIVAPAATLREAMATGDARRTVIRGGQVVAAPGRP